MRIYTRGGDRGETGLPGGGRLSKDAARLEVCGTVDELSALLGQVRAEDLCESIGGLIEHLQHELFEVGAELAGAKKTKKGPGLICGKLGKLNLVPFSIEELEAQIDRHVEALPPLAEFILPGGTRAAATLHLARAVCRRAERRLVTLARSSEENISPAMLAYFNRLGDLLFVLARAANAEAGQADTPWRKWQ